jgi:hypothetical protein
MSGLAESAGLIAGLAVGATHFTLLRRNTDLYLRPRGLGQAIALQGLRLALLAFVLVLLARQGALPLLLGALGVPVARSIVLRRVRGAAP